MIETPEANLIKGMRHLNGVFTQWSNRRHKRSGHLFHFKVVTTYGSIFATKGASRRINYTASSGRSYFDLPKRSLRVG
jgi:hypothetical protein